MDRCDNVIGLDIHAAFCNFEGHFLKEVGHDGTISSCWVDGVIFRDGHLHLDTKDFLSVEILPRLDVPDRKVPYLSGTFLSGTPETA